MSATIKPQQQQSLFRSQIISLETCVDALASGMLSRRAALQSELAVGLAVFAAEGGTSADAKQVLNSIYASAGYQCIGYKGADYKNINKRINITAALYDALGARRITQALSAATEYDAIRNLLAMLDTLNFYTLDDVLTFCDKPNNRTRSRLRLVAANDSVADPANVAQKPGKHAGSTLKRRAEDRLPAGAVKIDTEAVHVVIPPQATPAELLDVAMKLLALAKKREADPQNLSQVF